MTRARVTDRWLLATISSGMFLAGIRSAGAEESGAPNAAVPTTERVATSVALPAAQTAPSIAPPIATMITRVAPAIVKVRRGAWWGSGAVFGPQHTVVTSFELVDGPGFLQVVGSDGVTREGRVVAWSKQDDLALLEVAWGAPPAPLPAEHEKLEVGAEAVLLYEPRDPELPADQSGGWVAPLARFTRISRALPNELDLDLTVWDMRGDDGAPVLSTNGGLIGIVSRHTAKERRAIVTRVERIERLLARRHLQGEFSPAGQGRWFNSLFVTPVYSTIFDERRQSTTFLGAGVESGYRYNWLFGSASMGGFESNTRRTAPTTTESLTRFQLALQVGGEVQTVDGIDLFVGPGVSLDLDTSETTTVNDAGALRAVQRTRGRARPIIGFGLAEGAFFARDTFTISNAAEVRLDLGLVLGGRGF